MNGLKVLPTLAFVSDFVSFYMKSGFEKHVLTIIMVRPWLKILSRFWSFFNLFFLFWDESSGIIFWMKGVRMKKSREIQRFIIFGCTVTFFRISLLEGVFHQMEEHGQFNIFFFSKWDITTKLYLIVTFERCFACCWMIYRSQICLTVLSKSFSKGHMDIYNCFFIRLFFC